MLAFNNDYSHGAHPAVLQALVDTNMERYMLSSQYETFSFLNKYQKFQQQSYYKKVKCGRIW